MSVNLTAKLSKTTLKFTELLFWSNSRAQENQSSHRLTLMAFFVVVEALELLLWLDHKAPGEHRTN